MAAVHCLLLTRLSLPMHSVKSYENPILPFAQLMVIVPIQPVNANAKQKTLGMWFLTENWQRKGGIYGMWAHRKESKWSRRNLDLKKRKETTEVIFLYLCFSSSFPLFLPFWCISFLLLLDFSFHCKLHYSLYSSRNLHTSPILLLSESPPPFCLVNHLHHSTINYAIPQTSSTHPCTTLGTNSCFPRFWNQSIPYLIFRFADFSCLDPPWYFFFSGLGLPLVSL